MTLILNRFKPPHIHAHENTRTLMLDVIVMLLFLYGFAFFSYGPRALLLGAVSTATAVICDMLCIFAKRQRPNRRDMSAVVTGLLLPLLLPATIGYHIVIIAAVFAIVVAKHPFGGVGQNVFNPAAAGLSFAIVCFPNSVFLYPTPMTWLPLGSAAQASVADNPTFTLMLGGIPQYDKLDILLGNLPGPMGATNILVVIACLLYLVLRNTVRWQIPVGFLLTASLYALLFPRGGSDVELGLLMHIRLAGYELTSGCLLFGCVFLMGDPVTTPKRDVSKFAYAAVAGIVVMLFRTCGGVEEPFSFAILAMNATAWGFDMLGEQFARKYRRENYLKQSEKERIPS